MRRPISVYVAAKYEEKDRVREAYVELRRSGFMISHDWTSEDDTAYRAVNDDARTDHLAFYHMDCAVRDERGVEECDALILFAHPKIKGAAVEFGMARALKKHIIVIGADQAECVFWHLPGVYKRDSLTAAIELLLRLDDQEYADEMADVGLVYPGKG